MDADEADLAREFSGSVTLTVHDQEEVTLSPDQARAPSPALQLATAPTNKHSATMPLYCQPDLLKPSLFMPAPLHGDFIQLQPT